MEEFMLESGYYLPSNEHDPNGYYFYFGWFKPTDVKGEIFLAGEEPSPENYEVGSTLSDSEYQYILNSIEQTENYVGGTEDAIDRSAVEELAIPIRPYGWQKEKLFDAIVNSGLMVDKFQFIQEYGTTRPHMPETVLPVDALQIGTQSGYHLEGFDMNPYKPKEYYEFIYRRLFIDLPRKRTQRKRRPEAERFPRKKQELGLEEQMERMEIG